MSAAVDVTGLVVRFGNTTALCDLTLAVPDRRVISICGRPNTGKSALLGAILGQVRPERGDICVAGVSIRDHLTAARRTMTYVDGYGALVPHLTSRQNLLLMTRLGSHETRTRQELDAALRQSDLPDRVFDAPAEQLSPTESFSVCVAAARVRDSRVVLLDDPTTFLNPSESPRTATLIRELCDTAAVLVVTRDRRFADEVGDTTYILEDGRLSLPHHRGRPLVRELDELLHASSTE